MSRALRWSAISTAHPSAAASSAIAPSSSSTGKIAKIAAAAPSPAPCPRETYKQGIVQVALSNGTIAQLNAADIAAVDPLHIGINSYMLSLFKQYPAGNDPKAAADGGLNFSVLRFNAPQKLDNRAYVARMDFNLDSAGNHTLMLRGTLAGNARRFRPRAVPRPAGSRQDAWTIPAVLRPATPR